MQSNPCARHIDRSAINTRTESHPLVVSRPFETAAGLRHDKAVVESLLDPRHHAHECRTITRRLEEVEDLPPARRHKKNDTFVIKA